MKRFVVVLLLLTVIVGVLTYSMPKGLETYIEDISTNATVSIYCRQSSLDGINMGNGKIVQCDVADVKGCIAHCTDIDGFSVRFQGALSDVERIVRFFDVNITSTLDIDGIHIICGNSAKLLGGVNLDGVTVNLQIAYKDGAVTVGSPLILGDY